MSLDDKESFEEGRNAGFYRMYEIVTEAIRNLRNSIDDVWSIEYDDIRSQYGDQKKLKFASDTLTYLENIIEDKVLRENDERTDVL